MRLCFIGSGIEREKTRMQGMEIDAVARVVREHFDTLIFGGSSVGVMESFAAAFAASGGHVISVVPRWLQSLDLVFKDSEQIACADLAERKRLMFGHIDAVLCYPGGLGTWDELFDIMAERAIGSAVDGTPPCPPIYLYNWEKYYAPLLLQIETAVEVGLIHLETVAMLQPFESAEALSEMLRALRPGTA